jgi:cytochrome P450
MIASMSQLTAAAAAAPRNAVAAVTHPDPYPFYADLVASRPFYHDAELNLWIASSAEAVTTVLTHPAGRVRPIGQPVPPAIRGSRPGQIFGALVRMNDGEQRHDVPRKALLSRLETLSDSGGSNGRVEAVAEYRAHRLADAVRPLAKASDPDAFLRFALALPTHVIGSLLGVPDDHLEELTQLVGDLVLSFSALAGSDALSRGERAAQRLREIFAADASASASAATPGSLENTIGLLMQAQDATAALIATTLLTLARSLWLRDAAARAPALLRDIVEEVVRHDAPVQNTRRYLAEPATIFGQPLPVGTGILVVLAAANRDPAANAEPDTFEPNRPARRAFTFGLGSHACPGWTLATTIARAGVGRILASGIDIAHLDTQPAYRPYPNIRFPQIAWKA